MKVTQVTYAVIIAAVLISIPLVAAEIDKHNSNGVNPNSSNGVQSARAAGNDDRGNDDRGGLNGNGNGNRGANGQGASFNVRNDDDNDSDDIDSDSDDGNARGGNKFACGRSDDDDNDDNDDNDDDGNDNNNVHAADRTVTTIGGLTVITKSKNGITADQQNTINSVLAVLNGQTGRVKIDINGKNGKFHIDIDIGKGACKNNTTNNTMASISGTKFNDVNANGVMDANETGLANWTIYLDANNNGTPDAGEVSRVTGATGSYQFTGLAAGNYTVREVQKAGWTRTTAEHLTVALAQNASVTGINFGNFQPVVNNTGSINGTVFEDMNGNGARDVNDTGIANQTVVLSNNATTQTNANGSYNFTGLGPGIYNVSLVVQPGWTITAQPAQINLTTGASATANIGLFRSGVINGTVFNDANNNSVMDANETGLANWTVVLAEPGGNSTVQTGANGGYSFTGLSAGNYTVAQELQANWTQTLPPGVYTIAVVSGTESSGINFGNFQTT